MGTEIQDIKKIRRKLGLTQSELAAKADVSQSLIAKIEAGVLDPGYQKTMQIFDALGEMTRKEELQAGEIMHTHIVTVGSAENVLGVIKKMKKYAISQVPVVDGGKPVGIVTETVLVDAVGAGKDVKKLLVRDVMDACPPIVTPQTQVSAVAGLLHYFSVVLVSDRGHLKGLVSKADLIEKVV
jgi:predicted transcriptional regulator